MPLSMGWQVIRRMHRTHGAPSLLHSLDGMHMELHWWKCVRQMTSSLSSVA